MELKLDIYKDRKLKEVEKTLVVNDFELSTGACEDILRIINIDQFDDFASLSEEGQGALIMKLVCNGFELFKDILKDVFDDLTDDDLSRTKVKDVARVVYSIIKYSLSTLFSTFGGGKSKN